MPKRNLPTIREVAKKANVSTATVSHVFNNTRKVTEKTRKQVLDAAKKLKYQPSGIARSLSTKNTKIVGMLVADVLNPFFASLIRQISELLWDKGYNLLLCSTHEDPEKEKYFLQDLLERRVDGLIIAPTGFDQPIIKDFYWHSIPIVFIDRHPPHGYGPVVQTDNIKAGYISTEYLLKRGHRRIMIMTRNPFLSTVRGRVEGYCQAMKDYGTPVDEALIRVIQQQQDAARLATIESIQMPNPPTAIIATNQVITLGVLEGCKETKTYIPQQISIIGFDDLPWYSLLSTPLTAIQHPIQLISEESVKILSEMMDDTEDQSVKENIQKYQNVSDIFLEPKLIERDSCRFI